MTVTDLAISVHQQPASGQQLASQPAVGLPVARGLPVDGDLLRGTDAQRQPVSVERRYAAERDLIERAKRDRRGFAVLYCEHYEAIAGYVYRRTGDVHATEDLVADVFLTAMRSLGRYRYRGVPLRFWLYRIATNTVNRWIRGRRRRKVVSLDAGMAGTSKPACQCDIETSAADGRLDAQLTRKALLSLSPKHQTVLALHYFEAMSVEDVAAVTGWRIGTVKSRMSRAREALREKLSQGR